MGWDGACTSVDPVCKVTLNAAKATTATFILNTYTLTVTKQGIGSGVVASVPGGIDCGVDCGEIYVHGTGVTLTAAAATGSIFMEWTGACTGIGLVCQVTMDAAKSVTASFGLPIFLPWVSKMGSSGAVTSDVDAINCGNDCGVIDLDKPALALTDTDNVWRRRYR